MKSDKNFKVALVGNPNCGKTALFNSLTGSNQRVANYPGVTVEKKHGFLVTPHKMNCTLIDLPGLYSLRARSSDEMVTYEVLSGKHNSEEPIDLIICVLDATSLQNGLRLVLELKQCGKPMIIALNMMDIATDKGYKYDLSKLEKEMGCKIIETVAIKSNGVMGLVNVIDDFFMQQIDNNKAINSTNTNNYDNANILDTRLYNKLSSDILKRVILNEGTPSKWSEKIDNVVLSPIVGILILLTILFVLFQSVFSLAKIPQEMLQDLFDNLQHYITHLLPNSLLAGLLGNGVVAGVGAVVVFLPQILMISLFVILLEDSGYMSRAAFLMDRIMSNVGLHGKAFIPLLSSFACAIPGIMATRTIENKNERMVTILISPLMTCSARLPIYTLLISAFIPAKTILGIFNLQGLVMFILYAVGILFALMMALIFKIFLFKGVRGPSIMELPSYKLPRLKNISIELVKIVKSFVYKAGTIIVAIMIVLWALSTFPIAPLAHPLPAINYSLVGVVGHFIEPLFAPIGFTWQIVTALIPGIMAREVAISALGTIYAVSASNDRVTENLTLILQHSWSLATALSLIAWYVFAPQCASTLAVAKRETNSWKWPIIMFVYQIVLAYTASFIVYRIALLF